MPVPVILPIDGVDEELIRVLNDRFRQVGQPETVSTTTQVAASASAGVSTPVAWKVVATTAPALTVASGAISAVGGTAGAAYTATERALINALLAWSATVVTITSNLRTRVIELEAQVKALGFVG